jgi:hypothetical protein
MIQPHLFRTVATTAVVLALCGLISCTSEHSEFSGQTRRVSDMQETVQVPGWSHADLHFFLHGSMSTEFVPENALRAFLRTYPDLFPTDDFSNLGAIADPKFGWPIGFSRKTSAHLGGLPSIGVNCASCHVGEITPPTGGANVRVLGMTSQLDVETFFGVIIVSTFRTTDPANMKKFLAALLAVNDPKGGATAQNLFETEWQRQEQKIRAAMSAAPVAQKSSGLRPIAAPALRLDAKSFAQGQDLGALSVAWLDLFHNLRFALHVPDSPPPASPPNGPGRNDPWRILAYSLLGLVTEPAPVKFGVVWNEDRRTWVHDDGNTRSPIIRNLAASLGLGAPLIEHRGLLDFPAVQRHTALSEAIRSPRYPWTIDRTAAARGAKFYQTDCASCHDGPQTDARLYSIAQIGTDANRARIFTESVADGFNKFFAELQIAGYLPPQPPALRSTQKYWAPGLEGVWARPPYLHNGSVRTMQELLTPPATRAKTFHRGSRVYDPAVMGYVDEGAYALDTTLPGNANSGHDFGTQLSRDQKRDLIEFLKTL